MYKITRMYFREGVPDQTIKTGLTLDEAQEHCSDRETSSSTVTSKAGRERTRKYGRWFDGYEET